MSSSVIRPPVELAPLAGGPLYPKAKHPVLAAVLAVGFVGAMTIVALVAPALSTKLLMGSFAIFGVAVSAAAWRYATIDREGVARLSARENGVRFDAPAGMLALWIGLGLAAMLPAAVWIVLSLNGPAAPVSRMGGVVLLGIGGAVALVIELSRLRVPSGLTLTADGLSGVRGSKRVELTWNDVAAIDVVFAPRGARLWIRPVAGGLGIDVDSRLLESDPRLVSHIVEHYRTHPADRAELARFQAVNERLREGRFSIAP